MEHDDRIRAEAERLKSRGIKFCFLTGNVGQFKRPWKTGWPKTGQEPSEYRPATGTYPGDGIGIILGRLNDDLVCIDLDGPEANRLADDFLPKTAMEEGRPGKPRSHRYFYVTDIPEEFISTTCQVKGGPKKVPFNGPAGKRLMDFIGTGGQAAAPPSRHDSGETREWVDPDGKATTLPFMELWTAVLALAKACGWVEKQEAPKKEKKSKATTAAVAFDTLSLHQDTTELIGSLADAEAYVMHIKAVEKNNGERETYRVAGILLNDHNLDQDQAWDIFQRWNETNAFPPWSTDGLQRKFDAVIAGKGKNPKYPVGCKVLAKPEGWNAALALATRFMDGREWRYWHEKLYEYTGTHYRPISTAAVETRMWHHADALQDDLYRYAMKLYEDNGRKGKQPGRAQVTKKFIAEGIAKLESMTFVPDDIELGCMLSDGKKRPLIALRNGLFNLDTFERQDHTPDWWSTNCLPYEYDPSAMCVVLDKALATWMGGDQELIDLALEWFGCVVSGTTDYQSFMLLQGDGNNGKGAFSAALEAVVGSDNVSFQPWEALDRQFALVETVGKLLNISDDVGELSRSAIGTLKWFVGGKPMTFERKGQQPFTATPTARLMLAVNSVPWMADKSEGVDRRLLILPFNSKIPDDAKIPGMDKVAWWQANANPAGIFNRAIEGLKRLRAQGRFTRPAVSMLAKNELRANQNPEILFLADTVVADQRGKDIPVAMLYQEYRGVVENHGHKALSAQKFNTEVVRRFPGAERRARNVGGKSEPYWIGLRRFDAALDTPMVGLLSVELFKDIQRLVKGWPDGPYVVCLEDGRLTRLADGVEVDWRPMLTLWSDWKPATAAPSHGGMIVRRSVTTGPVPADIIDRLLGGCER